MPEHRENLKKAIRKEAERERSVSADELLARIEAGDIIRATGNLLFHTEPARFEQKLETLLRDIESVNAAGADDMSSTGEGGASAGMRHAIAFLTKLAVDLGSFLPEWNLNLDPKRIAIARNDVTDLLGRLERQAPDGAEAVREGLRREILGRLSAEAVENPAEREAENRELLGDSLLDYARNMVEQLGRSNFLRVARARKAGKTETEFGNDYAAFLQHVVRLGGSFVTTNPVLIKMAWDIDRELWNGRVDRLILTRYSVGELRRLLAESAGTDASRASSTRAAPDKGTQQKGSVEKGPPERGAQETTNSLAAAVETVSSMVTMAVVVENCRLLRDIFLVTEGREGYVSLQVNPKTHDEPERMVLEARALHNELEKTLGGVPNVVFKLPSTAAGLRAAEVLTAEGIGVTITLTFSVFQAVDFAKVLNRGNQLMSYIAIMNGRMAFPVRDELSGCGVPGGVEAARWAGVEVARKAERRLYEPADRGGLGVDRNRVKIMIASLRLYEDWIPDISELWGIPLITVFPNIRRAYDSRKRELHGRAVSGTTPHDSMEILWQSEIFRQAWWMPGDGKAGRPESQITLQDKDRPALASWPPVANTLNQFIDLYEQMGQRIVGRMRDIAGKGA